MMKLIFTVLLGVFPLVSQFPPPEPRARDSAAPATQPAPPPGATRFQDGVYIDWKSKCVLVDGRVVLRDEPLEFLACFAGKEHESVVRLLGSAAHIYQACGLVGLEPGHPPRFNEQRQDFDPPAGQLVDLAFEWDSAAVAPAPSSAPATLRASAQSSGRSCRMDSFQWMHEIEYLRPPISRPWVFAGSIVESGRVAADASGAGISVVDFADALFCLSRHFSERNDELWVEANPGTVPPLGTLVRMRISAATARRHEIRVDFRGDLWVDGRWTEFADIADLIYLNHSLDAAIVQEIAATEGTHADRARLTSLLDRAALPPGSWKLSFVQPSQPPAASTAPAPIP